MGYNLTEKGVSIVNIGNTAFLRYANIFRRRGGQTLNIPVSVITDLDVKPSEENDAEDGTTKKVAQATKRAAKYTGQKVRGFISDQWTFEYCLYKSTSLSTEFIEIAKAVHSGSDWTNFETELTNKLNAKSLNKTEISYKMAQAVEEDLALATPSINLDLNDSSIKYLIEAIKYACGD